MMKRERSTKNAISRCVILWTQKSNKKENAETIRLQKLRNCNTIRKKKVQYQQDLNSFHFQSGFQFNKNKRENFYKARKEVIWVDKII